ncbi:uncharacterized protein LOC113338417 [Papaver somniferum]|uniref:uncharacterized protein LOC113338417 n=1 Tax=Papaver somniferum TaxID=3469 RepID=UPI000E6FAC98|nr:uncharacterized protein LOC113338417 [Papaver somniferum]
MSYLAVLAYFTVYSAVSRIAFKGDSQQRLYHFWRWENHIEQHKNDSMQQDVGSVQILTVSQAETSSAIDWCHELQIDKVLFVSDNACHKWCNSCSTGSEDRNLVQHYVLFFI